MRRALYTGGKNPRVVIELNCDTDLLIAMIQDAELTPEQVVDMLRGAVQQVHLSLQHGMTKRAKEESS